MPEEKPRFQTEIQDVNLCHLVKLLSAEAAQGGPLGRLYADHLAHALVMKFLLATREEKLTNRHAASPLPRHLLQRVIERMNDLDVDLDLQSLANETGYSRTHFCTHVSCCDGPDTAPLYFATPADACQGSITRTTQFADQHRCLMRIFEPVAYGHRISSNARYHPIWVSPRSVIPPSKRISVAARWKSCSAW
jgi:hypothetical protein